MPSPFADSGAVLFPHSESLQLSPSPLEIPIIMMPLPMLPKDRIPVLIVRLPHLSLLFTDGIIPRIAPCLMPIRSTRVYRALAMSSGAPVMVAWPVLVVCLLSASGRARRRGVAGLGAAHCDYMMYEYRERVLRWTRHHCSLRGWGAGGIAEVLIRALCG